MPGNSQFKSGEEKKGYRRRSTNGKAAPPQVGGASQEAEMKIQIKARFTGSVLFEHEAEENTIRLTLEAAVSAGANLDGAYLDDKSELSGDRPVLQIGPIGSRCAYFVAYITKQGLRLRAGCFFGTRDEFEKNLADEHADNDHAKEYRAALAMIDAHAEIWTQKVEEHQEAA